MVYTNLQLGGTTLYPLIKPINGVKDIYSYQWGFDLTNQGGLIPIHWWDIAWSLYNGLSQLSQKNIGWNTLNQ